MTKFKPLACGYHSHTHFSLDGGSSPANKIIYADKIGRIADCVTDHGIMSGLMPHWSAAQKLYKDKKISKPIISIHGIEAYVIDEDRPWKQYKNGKQEPKYYHLTIHFKTAEAYHYMCSLSPVMEERGIMKYGELKPLLYLSELEPIAGQIVIGSGCLGGPVMANVAGGRSDLARQNYIKLRNLAGPGNFFAEIMPHCTDHNWVRPKRDGRVIIEPGKFVPIGPEAVRRYEDAIDPEPCVAVGEIGIDIQRLPNEFVIKMAKEFNDPIIISLDDHYAESSDRIIQELRISNGTENWRFYNSYHMMTSDEAADSLKKQLSVSDRDIEEWIDNSYKFVDLFSNYKMVTSKDRWLIPTTDIIYNAKGINSKEKLNEMIKKHGRMLPEDHPKYKEYKQRLDHEIAVLADNGLMDWLPYILLLEDLSEYCKQNEILCNVRGSAGGSLILYLLRISVTDPIKYNLPFERFITVDRIREGVPPDVDFDVEKRDPVIDYMRKKYGNKISLISNDNSMRLKSCILDTERAFMGSVSEETAAMVKAIPQTPQGVNDNEWLFGYKNKEDGSHVIGFWDTEAAKQLKNWAEKNQDMWETVKKAIGIVKTRGIHAGGVIVTPGPAYDYFPLISSDKGYACAYNMKFAEEAGALKYDILGVTTLEAISISLKSIQKDENKKIEWDEFPHDDKVYENIINSGKLCGIFQISTKTMRPFVARIKPKSIEDLSLIAALVRPGALDAPAPDPNLSGVTAAEYFVGVRNGSYKPYYIHPDVKHIFEETGGVCIYQEQLLQVFRDVAGYSFGQAEAVRRAVGKKIKALMEEHLGVLKKKCIEKGWSENQADQLVDTLVKSARYSFNKAHSASYGIVAYNGSWLKYHYPLHYWKGEFNTNNDNHSKIQEYIKECGDLVLDVDIIKSHPTEWMIEGEKLRPPLSVIKGCGDVGVLNIKNFIDKPLELYEPIASGVDEADSDGESQNEME